MSHSINGTWSNSYGSSMQLLTVKNQIYGTYSSHTGSTGVYLLVGSCSAMAPTEAAGQNVVFSIFWRNIEGNDPDDSWHWAGSMCGQLLADGKMTLENTIVVSVPFEHYGTGNYVDELVFTKQSSINGSESEIKQLFSIGEPNTADALPLLGAWANSTTQLTILSADKRSGLTKATFSQQGNTFQLIGFIDVYVGTAMAQSFSFSAYDSETQTTMTLCGALEDKQSQLMVYQWKAQSTSSNTSFMQSKLAATLLTKQKN